MASIMTTILGMCIGSFISVVDQRIDNDKKGLLIGRSTCPHCKNQIQSYDLIPVISFLLLKGKCRMCLNKISAKYPLLETSVGLSFLGLLNHFEFLDILLLTPFLTIFVAIVVQDLFKMQIESILLYLLSTAAFLYSYFMIGNPIENILIWGAVGFLFFNIQELLSKGKWVGDADCYIGLSIGMFLANFDTLTALFSAYWIATIIAIPYFLIKYKTIKNIRLPLIPFLWLGFYIQLVI